MCMWEKQGSAFSPPTSTPASAAASFTCQRCYLFLFHTIPIGKVCTMQSIGRMNVWVAVSWPDGAVLQDHRVFPAGAVNHTSLCRSEWKQRCVLRTFVWYPDNHLVHQHWSTQLLALQHALLSDTTSAHQQSSRSRSQACRQAHVYPGATYKCHNPWCLTACNTNLIWKSGSLGWPQTTCMWETGVMFIAYWSDISP